MKSDEDILGDIKAIQRQVSDTASYQQACNQFNNDNLDRAEEIARRILDSNPDHADTNHLLGIIAGRRGNAELAIQLITRAIQSNPQQALYYCNLGHALSEEGYFDEALPVYERALGLKPNDPETYNNYGNVLRELGRMEDALQAYEQSIQLNPRSAQTHTNRGIVLNELGRSDEAAASYSRALEAEPGSPEVYRNLVNVARITPECELPAQMEALYARADAGPEAKIHLGFGLGKALHDLGEFTRASRYYQAANQLKRHTFEYNLQDDVRKAEFLRTLFTPEYVARHAGSGVADDTPIFIVGMPRSGTSLAEQILASHPQVYGAGELPYLWRLSLDDSTHDMSWLSAPSPDLLKAKGQEYLQRLHARSGVTARFITDKMPANFWHIGLIQLILPKARIIHLRRDPRDTCLSIYSRLFPGHHPYAYELTELASYYQMYTTLMDHWYTLYPDRIHEVSYENLVEDLEGEVRRILDYCGLPFDTQCLEFHQSRRAVQTASALQVRQPIYRSSVGYWKSYEAMLQPLITSLR